MSSDSIQSSSEIPTVIKVCCGCGAALPLTVEFFYKKASATFGFSSRCRTCIKQVVKSYYANNLEVCRERVRNYASAHRLENNLASRAWRQEHLADCRAYARNYYATHLETARASRRAYAESHRSENRARAKRYASEHKAEVAERDRRYYQAHRQERRSYARAWGRGNREVVKARAHRYRARKLSAPGWNYTTASLIRQRWEFYGSRCYICGTPAVATDHVIPLARGGTHWPANLRPICTPCNLAKSAKSLDQFLRVRRMLENSTMKETQCSQTNPA